MLLGGGRFLMSEEPLYMTCVSSRAHPESVLAQLIRHRCLSSPNFQGQRVAFWPGVIDSGLVGRTEVPRS